MFNGKIHYFNGHFQLLFVCSPEGIWVMGTMIKNNGSKLIGVDDSLEIHGDFIQIQIILHCDLWGYTEGKTNAWVN